MTLFGSVKKRMLKRPATGYAIGRFKYYIHDHSRSLRLQLFGEFGAADVLEIDGCWNTARTSIKEGRKVCLDLEGVTSADEEALRWLLKTAASVDAEMLLSVALAEELHRQSVTAPAASSLLRFKGIKNVFTPPVPAA